MPNREDLKFCKTPMGAGRLFIMAAVFAAALLGPTSTLTEARSSGGYSRPSMSSYSRSSSFGSSRGGGYVRPQFSAPRQYTLPSSPGDRAVSRRAAEEALKRFRSESRPSLPEYERPRRPSFSPPPREEQPRYEGPRYSERPTFEPRYRPSQPTSEWGWNPPPSIRPPVSNYNGWNPFLFWFLLDRLAQSGNGDFFHHHQNDPGYGQWRADAERKARNDPDLRAKLDELDAALVEKKDQPRDPSYLPKGVTKDSARASAEIATTSDESSGDGVALFIVIVVIVGAVAFIFYVRARYTATKGKPVGKLETAGNLLRHKLSGTPVTLKPFRVGMALTIDPTPFILAKDAIKVPVPKVEGKTSFASVRAIGTFEGAPLFRLYLADDSFVQLHLDGNTPDECRYFAQIDEVTPGDADDWKAWLDPGQGMIGWPQFQTKDGKLYDRVWSPGTEWTEPVQYVERREGGAPTGSVKGVMMLYGAPTGLAEPTPQAEYILVASVEPEGGDAWIAIHAGIDVNPAGLSLT